MSLRLAVRDNELSGDFRAVVYYSENPGFDRYIQISYGTRVCGAMVEFVQSDEKEVVYVDKYIRLFLKARIGDLVNIDACRPELATSITIVKPQVLEIDAKGLSDDIQKLLWNKPVCKELVFPRFNYSGGKNEITIYNTSPVGIVLVQKNTKVLVREEGGDGDGGERHKDTEDLITWSEIGGLEREVKRIRHLIEYPLRHQATYGYFGVEAPRGVLLYGPPGTGKTRIAKALKNEVGANMYVIQGPDVVTPYQGESERRLREIFEKASANAPAVILIDEIDALVPRRDLLRSEVMHGLVSTMLTLLDGLRSMKGVIVIGTTNRVSEIDPALRRPGRLEYEIMIGSPDRAGRKQILKIHTRNMPLDEKGDVIKNESLLDSLADATAGFTGADIASLCREAGRCALLRYFPEEALESGRVSFSAAMKITLQDFLEAMKNVQPSAMRGTIVEIVRDTTFDQIGGCSEAKEMLMENIVYGIKRLGVAGIRPAKGVLLYGPSGTGKTMLARATAAACQANLITLRGPEIHRKWFGESEELVRATFTKAREVAPCIILLEELDSLAPERGRDTSGVRESITSQVIGELEQIRTAEQVFIIATTNQPDLVDPALRRPGRLDVEIPVKKPKDEKERQEIFTIHLKGFKLDDDVDLTRLARETKGFSGADISECCRRAKFQASKEVDHVSQKVIIKMAQMEQAIERVRQTDRFRMGQKGQGGF